MKLRTQLILAFLLLAVVPLGAITLYSYETSARALRRTVEAESSRMAGELNNRMGVVTANLSRRIDMLESLPFPETRGGSKAEVEEPDAMLVGRLVAALGETANFIDSFEFTPSPAPPEPPDGRHATGGHATLPARPGTRADRQPIVVPLPRIVGEMAKDPKLQPVIKMAASFLTAEEAGKIKKELDDNLGRGGQDILKIVKDRIRTEVEARRAAAEKERPPEPRAALALKQEFGCPLIRNGQTVGHLKAKVSADRLLREILSQTKHEQGEIPFALDGSGNLFTPNQADPATLRGLEAAAASGQANAVGKGGVREEPAASRSDRKFRIGVSPDENWVVVTREDPVTGLVFGIARPVGAALGEIRSASARNLGAGLGLAALALFGIVPISRRMTHNLSDLTRAAGELAAGRLDTQVPVRSRDELGQLAQAFNRMAHDLKTNQERLVEQERLRKELELCRRIQNELLPKKPMLYPFAELQGLSIPAHELGGDFFNYFDLPGGEVALLMGDVSGKGVPAALLMANLQATIKARIPLERDLATFARQLDRDVETSTPPEVYLTLFLGVLDPARRALRYVNAGHESPFVLRRDGRLERLDPTGRPIGLMSGGAYAEKTISLEAGDRLFLYTDGLVDAEDDAGGVFGPARLETLLSEAGSRGPADLLARVERAYQDHRGKKDAADDATLLVLRVGDWTATRPETRSETVVPPPIVRDASPFATL